MRVYDTSACVHPRTPYICATHTHTCLLLLHVLGDACKPSAFHNTHDHACAKSQNRLVYMIYFVMRMPMCTQHPSSDQAVAMGLEEQGSSESTDLCGCDVRVFFMLLQSLHCFGTVFRFFFCAGHARPNTLTRSHMHSHTQTHTRVSCDFLHHALYRCHGWRATISPLASAYTCIHTYSYVCVCACAHVQGGEFMGAGIYKLHYLRFHRWAYSS